MPDDTEGAGGLGQRKTTNPDSWRSFLDQPAETFSSTSNVRTAGHSCNIIVRVQGAALGAHVNTTSQSPRPRTADRLPPTHGDSGSGRRRRGSDVVGVDALRARRRLVVVSAVKLQS